MRVVTHHGEVRYVASRLETFRYRAAKPYFGMGRQSVDMRFFGVLQGRLAAQVIELPIGHTVAEDNNVFHVSTLLSKLPIDGGNAVGFQIFVCF